MERKKNLMVSASYSAKISRAVKKFFKDYFISKEFKDYELKIKEHNNANNLILSELEKADFVNFDGNFNQMVNFGEKNHAKVFHIINGKVVLWKPVSEFILFEYEKIK